MRIPTQSEYDSWCWPRRWAEQIQFRLCQLWMRMQIIAVYGWCVPIFIYLVVVHNYGVKELWRALRSNGGVQ